MANSLRTMETVNEADRFSGQSKSTLPGNALFFSWLALLILAGILFYCLPPSYKPWAFWSFLGGSLAMLFSAFGLVKKLRASSDRLAYLVHQTRDLLWTLDSNLCFTSVCGAVEPIAGQPAQALENTPLTRLLSNEKARAFEMMIKNEKAFVMEAGIQQSDGRFLAVEIRGEAVQGSAPNRFQGMIRDVSDQKRQERRQQELRQKLDRSEKLKNLGLLAGSVAHDLNNILSGIATYPEVMLMDEGLDPKTRQGLEMIKESGRNASSVVSDLLTISRGARADKQILNINTVVERYMSAAEFEKIAQTYSQVEIEVDIEPELLNISGSYIHIEKAIMNLMLNAVEETAKQARGRVTLSTANHYADGKGDDDLVPGEYVMLRVEDNGSGIPEALQHKIFDPFFSQKEMGLSGTGLGLTVVRNTIDDHKGKIQVRSKESGTCFEILFPAIREELPAVEDPDSLAEIMGKGETLLIVDDLASQRKIATTILRDLGYKVFSVGDGMDALAFVKEMPVDLLILDMVMAPSISGLETYRRIKEIRPDQKAIIASGHPESDDVFKTQELGAGSFVKKPYTILDMGIAVKEELEK